MIDLGRIDLYRKILEWEWYSDINTCRLFIHMLLKANWKEAKFKGTTVPRGSFVSSLDKLSEDTKLTKREIRTAISHLKMTGELTVKTTNKYSVFIVNNYNLYQHSDTQNESQETNERQPNDFLSTTIESINQGNQLINKKNTMCKSDALALFENLWSLYPVKKGKGQVSLAAKQRLLKVGYEEMARAIDRYKSDLEKDIGWRKPQNGSTFFNSGYVDYLDGNYQEQEASAFTGTDNQSRDSAADYYKKYLMDDDADKKGGDTVGTANQNRRQAADCHKRYLGTGDGD